MSIRVGIVGVSGYGGGEALRLCATHPSFKVVYVAGEGSAALVARLASLLDEEDGDEGVHLLEAIERVLTGRRA